MRLLVVALFLFASPSVVFAGADSSKTPGLQKAIDRGLAFLVNDAQAWRDEHKCASCHHAGMVIWSMREAKQRGHAVDESVLAELTKWVADSGPGKSSIPRPEGRPKAFNTKAVYFALALGADPNPDAASQKGMALMIKTVVEDQIDSGSWVAWPETRPPMFGASDESMSALATLALHAAAPRDESAKAARDKGIEWLAQTKTDDDPQSIALRLILWAKTGRPAAERDPLVQRILQRQNADGGWSQAKEMPSDAWATGQALYALAHAGIGSGDARIQRAQAFLVKTQRDDGSWPMTSRPAKPGDKGAKNLVPIIGAGSAWAILGLVCSQ